MLTTEDADSVWRCLDHKGVHKHIFEEFFSTWNECIGIEKN